jgi:MraZ protein
MPDLFYGNALCPVDADGTVCAPAFLAGIGEPDDAAELVVARHQAEPCLLGYGRDHLATLAERAERRRLAEEVRGEEAARHYHRMRGTFGLSERLDRDRAKLRLSPAMRHLGRIGALALFVGAGDSFEIWNPELALASDDAQLRALADFRLRMRTGAPHGEQ